MSRVTASRVPRELSCTVCPIKFVRGGWAISSPALCAAWTQGDPAELLSPYVREGMTVLEPGPGMGFFTLALARSVGPRGRVIAVDLQPRMIESLKRRAGKANLLDRIDARVTTANTLGVADLTGKVDFILAFAMVHELPNVNLFFQEVAMLCKPGAQLLLVEPSGHVSDVDFAAGLASAATMRFVLTSRPKIRRSQAALLVRGGA